MQTFLPYPDFAQSAKVLDNKRLGKQRVECLQILQTLAKGKYKDICKCGSADYREQMIKDGKRWCDKCREEFPITPWYNHPAVRMWRGYEHKLFHYALAICEEWINRGFEDSCKLKLGYYMLAAQWTTAPERPPWLSNEQFHASHRSNLLRKDPVYYSQFGWTEPNNLPYVWPV